MRLTKVLPRGTYITERTGSNTLEGYLEEGEWPPQVGLPLLVRSSEHPGEGVVTSRVGEIYPSTDGMEYLVLTVGGSTYTLTRLEVSSEHTE